MPDVIVRNKAGETAKMRVLDPDEHIQRYWMKGAFYEPGMLEWTRRHYRGGTFIDAGACIGNHTVYYAKFCGADRVVAIEPYRPSFEHLRTNVDLNGLENVEWYNGAISDTPGKGTMIDASPKNHNNVGMRQVKEGDEIDILTLDSIIEEYELDDVTLLKIDVEHMEMQALRGADKLLREQHPAIFIECPYDETYKEVEAHLAQYGYRSRSQHNATPTYEFIVPSEATVKILQIGQCDFANAGYFLAEAINRTTDHMARSVRYARGGLGFPYDILNPDEKKLRRWWQWADVIHIHDKPGPLPLGMTNKPTVITHHGSWYRAKPMHYNSIAQASGWVATVATVDLTRFGLPLLPDTRPNLSQYSERSDQFTVAHSPTGRDKKRTDVVIAACKKVGVPLDIIEGTPWRQCIERRSRAHVVADQLTNGFGCTAIESMMCGQPVIAGADSIEKLRGIRAAIDGELPVILSSPDVDDLAEQIARLRDDHEHYAHMVEVGHEYVNRVHSYEAVAEKALEFYRKAMSLHASRRWHVKAVLTRLGAPHMPPKGQKRDDTMTVLRYVGKKYPCSWNAPSGVRYEFGIGREEGFVYDKDVAWFLEQKGRDRRSLFRVGG